MVRLVLWGLWDRWVHKDYREFKVILALKDQLVILDNKESEVIKEFKDPPDHKVFKEFKVTLDQQEIKAYKG